MLNLENYAPISVRFYKKALKTFFILKSLSIKNIMQIDVKMLSTFGILTLISKTNTISDYHKQE